MNDNLFNETESSSWSFIPFGSNVPNITRVEADRLYTDNGDEWLDAASGAAVGNIGWGRPEVGEAIQRAVTKRTYVLPTMLTEERIKLITRLRSNWLPKELPRIYFANGGSDAVDAAVRLARLYHVHRGEGSRTKFIGRNISYHGTTLSGLSVGDHTARRMGLEPYLQEFPRAPQCYCLRCPMQQTYPDCHTACATELESIILREGPNTIAAFIAEPIVGSSGGAIVPKDEYWPLVAAICKKYGILFIADEIMTGFGRTGTRFSVNHWNIVPDIMILGKGLTGGYSALSAVAATDDVVAPFIRTQNPLMFYTFAGHPAACAAADTVLQILETENLVDRVAIEGRYLSKKLAGLKSHPNVAEVRGKGFLWAVELVKDRESLERFPAKDNVTIKVVECAKKHGVLFYPGGTTAQRDIIIIAPLFISKRDSFDKIADVLLQAINKVTGCS